MRTSQKRVSIIIPFYNHWKLVSDRLLELNRFIPLGHEVVLVNDASEEDVTQQVAFWQSKANYDVSYYINPENLGFGKSMNVGAKVALQHKADVLVFLSNDVEVGKDFVNQLIAIFTSDNKLLVGAELMDWDTGWNKIQGTIIPYLNGWFLSCTAESWKELGGFDDRYAPFDYEDVDLSLTALTLGYELVQLYDSLIPQRMGEQTPLRHMGGRTAMYNEERGDITRRNRQRFIEKWQPRMKEINVTVANVR